MKQLRLWSSRALTVATRGVEEFALDRGHRLAAQIAYHVLFSLFPLALLMTAVLGLIFGSDEARERVVDFLRTNIPLLERQTTGAITEALQGVTTGAPALGIGAALVLVWSATAMMAAVRDALNVAWEAEDTRPLFRGKLVDLLLVMLVGVAVAGSFAFTLVATAAGDALNVPLLEALLEGSLLVSLLISFAAFTFLYRIVPSVETRLADIWPGIVVATLLFEGLKRLFGVYIENFASYNVVYGPLGAVAAFLFFVFLGANTLVLGAEVASEWPAVARGEHDEDESEPLGTRVKRFLLGLFVRQREDRG